MTVEPATGREPLLEIDGLDVTFPGDDGDVRAVRGLTCDLRHGEVLGIVGESGSGKSVTAKAVLGLLPPSAKVSGSVRFRGQELVGASEHRLRAVRGSGVALVFQDPMTSLNPVYAVGAQIAEAVRAHHDVSRAAAHRRAVELLDLVGIPRPAERVHSYPHELSGGMRQRVVIAIAMANEPDVIVADEPTTALDVTVQAQVLQALETLRTETGAAMILITHDLGVVAGSADRVLVMYAGRPVEVGTVDDVFYRPRMPYTLGLLGSLPRLDRRRRDLRLTPITGSPPSLVDLPPGCPFAPRCPLRRDACDEHEPDLRATTAPEHVAACHFAGELAGRGPTDVFVPTANEDADEGGVQGGTARGAAFVAAGAPDERGADGPPDPDAPILSVRGLVKHYPVRGRGLLRRRTGEVHAVCGVDLELRPGETLGLVGESGCGKTTTGRAVLNLQPPSGGEVAYQGRDVTGLRPAEMRRLRRRLQIVFQDPYSSLDPRQTVNAALAEPLRIHGLLTREAAAQIPDLLRLVGLDPEHGNRYPHQFSGGQRQRIGVARALVLRPDVIVLDEPVSALDVSIQAGLVNLLEELQQRLGVAYLFVAHDLSVVRHIAHRVAVMYLGRIVETASCDELFDRPAHPYTQALISAVPLPDPHRERARTRVLVTGDVPNPADPPSGCRFRTRCPVFAGRLDETQQARCVEETPELVDRGQGHPTACHYAEVVDVV